MAVLLRVIVKELLQLRRDRRMLPLAFVAPVFQLLALGYAANLDVAHVPLLVVDQDRTATSRELLDRFTASGYFDRVGSEASIRDIDRWLVSGQAQVAVVVGPGYGEAVASGRSPEVQVIGDGSDATSAAIGLSYAATIVSQASRELVVGALARAPGRQLSAPAGVGEIELVPRVWYNPDLRSRWFYVPAVLALVVMVMTLVLSSMGVVREKEVGTMEQVIVTPIRPWQLIVGKLFPFAVIGLVDVLLVSALVLFWFGVPMRGSFLLFVALTQLLVLTNLGLGLLVSTVARTQQQAMIGAAFILMLPQVYLSGLIFPVENMPPPIQLLTLAIPLRHYTEILRGILLKGSGIAVLWPQAAALAAFGTAFLTLASLRFRKRLD